MKKWFYWIDDQQHGPVAEEVLFDLFMRREIKADTLVAECGEWVPFASSPLARALLNSRSHDKPDAPSFPVERLKLTGAPIALASESAHRIAPRSTWRKIAVAPSACVSLLLVSTFTWKLALIAYFISFPPPDTNTEIHRPTANRAPVGVAATTTAPQTPRPRLPNDPRSLISLATNLKFATPASSCQIDSNYSNEVSESSLHFFLGNFESLAIAPASGESDPVMRRVLASGNDSWLVKVSSANGDVSRDRTDISRAQARYPQQNMGQLVSEDHSSKGLFTFRTRDDAEQFVRIASNLRDQCQSTRADTNAVSRSADDGQQRTKTPPPRLDTSAIATLLEKRPPGARPSPPPALEGNSNATTAQDSSGKPNDALSTPPRAPAPQPDVYEAVLTCGINGQHLAIAPCFSAGVRTDLDITNGGVQRILKFYELGNAGREASDGLHIRITPPFSLTAQNASDNLVLALKVTDVNTNTVSFQRQVGRFGILQFRQ